jgi:hypothetical protein
MGQTLLEFQIRSSRNAVGQVPVVTPSGKILLQFDRGDFHQTSSVTSYLQPYSSIIKFNLHNPVDVGKR